MRRVIESELNAELSGVKQRRNPRRQAERSYDLIEYRRRGISMVNARLCLLITSGILAGCATQPGKDQAANNANASGPDVQCHSVESTGSMLHQTVCTTKAQRDAQQKATQDLKEEAGQQAGVCRSPNGQC
jgi:hypothetical protein